MLFVATPLEFRAVTVTAQVPFLRPITAVPETRRTVFDLGASADAVRDAFIDFQKFLYEESAA